MLQNTAFHFLRHGQTDWNRERRCQGQVDIPLNPTGVSQAHHAKARLSGLSFATVCTSPLGRARQTAEIVNQALGCPLVEIDELQECGFGKLEGETIRDETFDDWFRIESHWGAEPFGDFCTRAIAGINQALEHPGPVLVVSHGGVYRALQIHAALEKEGDIANGVPVRLDPPANGAASWSVHSL